jgi:hypothetical protein
MEILPISATRRTSFFLSRFFFGGVRLIPKMPPPTRRPHNGTLAGNVALGLTEAFGKTVKEWNDMNFEDQKSTAAMVLARLCEECRRMCVVLAGTRILSQSPREGRAPHLQFRVSLLAQVRHSCVRAHGR